MKTERITKGAELLFFVPLFSLLGVATGCNTGGEDDVNGGDGDADTDTDTSQDAGDDTDQDAGDDTESDSDTGAAEAPYTAALVITADAEDGAYARVFLDDREVEKDIHFIHSDAICRFDPVTDTPFILNRLDFDSVDVLDPETFEIVKEYSVEASGNPYDIAVVSEERAYIARYGMAEMLIAEPLTGDALGTVDISDYADDDGTPEMAGAEMRDGKVYTALQLLDQNNYWIPSGPGVVLVIDGETGDVEKTVEVTGANIYDGPRYNDVLEQFVLTETGSFTVFDGGIELLDPETNSVSGFIVTEETLGGDVTKGLVVSETKGYALISNESFETKVVSFNPESGELTDTVLDGDGWLYVDMALTPDGSELWVAAGSSAAEPGIRIFDTSDDSEITDAPIDTGLPPAHICFTR